MVPPILPWASRHILFKEIDRITNNGRQMAHTPVTCIYT